MVGGLRCGVMRRDDGGWVVLWCDEKRGWWVGCVVV